MFLRVRSQVGPKRFSGANILKSVQLRKSVQTFFVASLFNFKAAKLDFLRKKSRVIGKRALFQSCANVRTKKWVKRCGQNDPVYTKKVNLDTI